MDPREGSIVVGVGELLWDCFGDERRPGGAPANVAFHAAQLGHRGAVVSRVGRDADGRALRAALVGSGLDLDHLQEDPLHPTGTVTVDTSDPGRPQYTIHADVAWDHLAYDADLAGLAPRAAAVCFGTLAQRSEGTREALHRFLSDARGALRVYDVNLRQDFWQRGWIERSLSAAHAVKLNRDEVAPVAACLGVDSADPRGLARVLFERFAVELVVVTRAEDGCLALEPRGEVDLPGRPVEVADAVGAGDAFTAALISARLAGWELEPLARFANEVGALVASRAGAMPALGDELARLRARIARG